MKRRILLELPGQSPVIGENAAPIEAREGLRQDVGSDASQAVVWAIGDTGPGGGIVFYDAGSRQSWGRYLEAAPAGWYRGGETDPRFAWCVRDKPGYNQYLDTAVDVGSGRSNSALIIKNCGKKSAAGAAAGYRGGGMDDWFLPSKDELNALYQQRGVVGALADDFFWSSSQNSDYAFNAWFQGFGDGSIARVLGWSSPRTQYVNSKESDYRVRPVRAF